MKTYALPMVILLGLCPSAAQAQVRVGVFLGLPIVPRLEIVAPGIQVVAGFQEEVFLQGGWYWCRRSDGWYRSRDHQSRFAYVESRRVPRGLRQMPEGHYRNWHRENRGGNDGQHDRGGHGRGHGNDHEGRGEHGRR